MQTKPVEQAHLTFETNVIEKIVGVTARKINGILSFEGGMLSNITDRLRTKSDPTQGITAEVGEHQTRIEMNVVIEYGYEMQSVFEQVCKDTADAIKQLTGLTVIELDFNVVDVMTQSEWKNANTGKPNSTLDPNKNLK
ncbi:Asp23/Gls24 family envelope stress response protein [Pediococcus claussenii]|uniref:Stress response regulator gls24 homolog n=1 Tax=Pediococcus claussenii (strain ATCC BAA-344 / DSM 14800 / JCM 18046 / KCTC 3811 / LMG 21948 / P06) TaxID=701521 RepID=G8PAK3_PEDCP|nr:Asp23/Gls24 family envelope stress response protein [Pediococcus claussenii]AEV95792.1 hypothetical protein PECL_1574 [Pediococcus claussenii ATCC BAA-344]ANZ69292.1 alkaline-shock protein [Pediococcus claussenii]ANZ71112.1 alkaline-shock protein [Pediococcus claussenii]KRN20400.1 hypothetical protein IV79_GL000455 [Pediococcus claussenii]